MADTEQPPADIVLVHGAWHTPRVWDPVAARLRAAGHHVSTPDLRFDEKGIGADEFADVVADACVDLADPLVVAHTSGCLVTPLVPARCKVGGLAFVNGLLPLIGSSFTEQLENSDYVPRADDGRQYDRDARSFWMDRDKFIAALAADLDKEGAERVWAQLRPQARTPLVEKSPLKAWPDVPIDAIVYIDDADLPVDWLRRQARSRVGAPPLELRGSQLGFLAHPDEFVVAIQGIISRARSGSR